jgi:hypothetical protein
MASRVLSLSTAGCLEMPTQIDADESPPQHRAASGFAGQPSAGPNDSEVVRLRKEPIRKKELHT